jgi:hypothetical protein
MIMIEDSQRPDGADDAEMDTIPAPEPADERDEDRCRIVEWFERSACILNARLDNCQSERQVRMAVCAWQFALGFRVSAGATITECAKRFGVTKAAFTKSVNHFEELSRLDPLPGQRKAGARRQMSAARSRQLIR